MTAVAPRPVCRLIVSLRIPTIDGDTIVTAACCGQVIQHSVDTSGDDDAFSLTAFWDDEGSQVSVCRCGNALPDAKTWRP